MLLQVTSTAELCHSLQIPHQNDHQYLQRGNINKVRHLVDNANVYKKSGERTKERICALLPRAGGCVLFEVGGFVAPTHLGSMVEIGCFTDPVDS